MAATLEQIRVAMAAALEPIPELQVEAWMIANPSPPTAMVFPDEGTYDLAMSGGLDELTMLVQAVVATVSDKGSQKLLDRYLAPSGEFSIKAALEHERPEPCRLGGVIQDLRVTGFTYRQFARPIGDVLLGAEFTVRVFN